MSHPRGGVWRCFVVLPWLCLRGFPLSLAPGTLQRLAYYGPYVAAYVILFDGIDESCVKVLCIGFLAFFGFLHFVSFVAHLLKDFYCLLLCMWTVALHSRVSACKCV